MEQREFAEKMQRQAEQRLEELLGTAAAAECSQAAEAAAAAKPSLRERNKASKKKKTDPSKLARVEQRKNNGALESYRVSLKLRGAIHKKKKLELSINDRTNGGNYMGVMQCSQKMRRGCPATWKVRKNNVFLGLYQDELEGAIVYAEAAAA